MSVSLSVNATTTTIVPVQTYLINTDTSLTELARQSGVSVKELRDLNQGKLLQREKLTAGESLYLPATSPLFPHEKTHALKTQSLPELGSDPHASSTSSDSSLTEQRLAELAKSVGGQDWKDMTGSKVKQQAAEWAKGKVVSSLQQQAQNFLGPFGKAQVNLVVDDKGNFSRSSASLFTPWYDKGSNLIYSQVGVHNQDGRIIGNFGVGQRWDLTKQGWLFGYNAFYDHDFSRDHNRLGLGAEAWTDNLKLAANYYLPLSGWKDSPDFDDYEERPARGFDVRAQGYLPAYPQLGASLVYEKYYGDNVALFGKDNLQKSPSAVTVGIDYTPIPLVTLKVSHKQGQGSKQEEQANLTLNYQMGTPLEKQLSPDYVATARSLKGSRYDLVDRNYDIVLEYREKQVLSVDLSAVPTTLLEGDTYVMQPLVRSKYTITAVRWNGDVVPLGLKATAGENNPQGWQITLPTWDPTPGASNIYHLSITVTDERDHKQTSNDVDIIVGENRSGDLTILGVSSTPSTGLATDMIHLIAQVLDQNGRPVQDNAVKPKWEMTDVKTGKAVPLITETECPVNSGNIEEPCVRVQSSEVTSVNGINQYHLKLVSTLAGDFSVAAMLGQYGKTKPLPVRFSKAGPESTITRVEIIAPDGSDALVSNIAPKVGSTYRVKFYNKANVNITDAIPADDIHWILDNSNPGPLCPSESVNVDTGVTGYTFTPRTNNLSNTNSTCGDQGYRMKVVY
ncbi:inverse autotransporter beta domain-containing protein [Yersinia intermedia]|uniref:inverse autotransporter beta domain-containing protein n=1 Tax=Yersinia intermedia TaxID=631 RepID=UPI0020A07116|nr:inverse autotransporter beta domain-containing protein [Yersinia intermedia]